MSTAAQISKCANCKKSEVYADGEKYCNDCWYTLNFEEEE